MGEEKAVRVEKATAIMIVMLPFIKRRKELRKEAMPSTD